MKFTIKIKKDLRAEDTEIGTGATILLNKATRPIVCLLRFYFLTQPDAIEGSRAALTHLFSFPGQPDDPDWEWLNEYIKQYAQHYPTADKS